MIFYFSRIDIYVYFGVDVQTLSAGRLHVYKIYKICIFCNVNIKFDVT